MEETNRTEDWVQKQMYLFRLNWLSNNGMAYDRKKALFSKCVKTTRNHYLQKQNQT